jgi:hypothetical protein
MAFALSTLIARGVGVSSCSSSLLSRGAEVGIGVKLSLRSTVEVWWRELVIDDERVEGTRDGVALLEILELRSENLRENEGNRLSNFPAMLCADASIDRLRFALRSSVSWVVKYSCSGSYALETKHSRTCPKDSSPVVC